MRSATLNPNNYSFTKTPEGEIMWPAAAILEQILLEGEAGAEMEGLLTAGEPEELSYSIPRKDFLADDGSVICDLTELIAEGFYLEITGESRCEDDEIIDTFAFSVEVEGEAIEDDNIEHITVHVEAYRY